MFFLPFLYSGILELALGVLKMVFIYVSSWCITNSNLLVCSWYDMALRQFVQLMYIITVTLCYLQILDINRRVLC